MLLVGCKPAGRHTEQHDVFFSIGETLSEIVPGISAFWPNSGTVHIDAWRTVTETGGYNISVIPKQDEKLLPGSTHKLFFLNLGGYKPGEFEEYHYKMLAVADNKSEAIRIAKQTAFYQHTGFKGAESHIDDKYGVDVDDIFEIKDILSADLKEKYSLHIKENKNMPEDEWHIGYTVLNKIPPHL